MSILQIFDQEFLTFLVRILCSILVSFIIGFERELTGHKGSIKTNVLISLGACIFSIFESFICVNDTRMAANIITGVGFLCSGFIFKNGLTVSGLGTAATLWCSAGVGILTSRGFLKEAFVVSLILFVLNLFLAKINGKIKPLKAFDDSNSDIVYSYNIVCLKESVDEIKKIVINNTLSNLGLSLESLNVKTITEDKVRVVFDIKCDSGNISDIDKILEGTESLKGILAFGWKQEEI